LGGERQREGGEDAADALAQVVDASQGLAGLGVDAEHF